MKVPASERALAVFSLKVNWGTRLLKRRRHVSWLLGVRHVVGSVFLFSEVALASTEGPMTRMR